MNLVFNGAEISNREKDNGEYRAMARDRAGNSLKKANQVQFKNGNFRIRDAIGQNNDSNDLYQLVIGTRSRLAINVSRQQRTGNADVELYELARRQRRVLREIGRPDFDDLSRRDIRANLHRVGRSRNKRKKSENLNITLDAGTYYIRVFPKTGSTRYQLRMSSTPEETSLPIVQPPTSQPPGTLPSPPQPATPFIQVTTPNGGESFQSGDSLAIAWTDQVDGPVQINLFSDGNKVRTITDATPSDGIFRWDIPASIESGNTYTIRITSTTNPSLFDDSDSTFQIQSDVVSPKSEDPSEVFNIQFDYRFDTNGWFTPERKAVLESVADIWENIIQDEFDPVPAGTSIYVENPEKEGVFEEFDINYDIDDIVIFVGSRNRGALAEGGPSALYFTGTTLDTRFNGSDFEPWSGFITFNRTEDWFFDSTPDTVSDLPANKIDFLSVALHEIGHVLGYGTSNAFDALVSGERFIGEASQAQNGGNPVPLAKDTSHIKDGYEFGGSGELMFDPFIDDGDRTLPTRLDVSALQDIGYSIDYSKTFQNKSKNV
ncbi:MAG: Ser-Thr-rich GPI-anchored membrane family protein [Cyanobacteria bacterium P01_E01_bin.6]